MDTELLYRQIGALEVGTPTHDRTCSCDACGATRTRCHFRRPHRSRRTGFEDGGGVHLAGRSAATESTWSTQQLAVGCCVPVQRRQATPLTRSNRNFAVAAAYCEASSTFARELRGWTRSHSENTTFVSQRGGKGVLLPTYTPPRLGPPISLGSPATDKSGMLCNGPCPRGCRREGERPRQPLLHRIRT
jgi:hypothetical protein